MKVGFIGDRPHGPGMARRILDAGHDLAVYNRTRAKAEAAAATAGATSSIRSPTASRHASVVITMLTDDAALARR